MAKAKDPKQEIQRVGPAEVPAYLRDKKDESLATLKEHRVIPRLKVIQGLSDEQLKDQFGEGATIVRPGDTLVVEKNGVFQFVPMLLTVQYITWADRKDQSAGMILDRSFDKSSPVAQRALDINKRVEFYGTKTPEMPNGQFKKLHCEHLDFIGFIYGEHPLARQLVSAGFVRGEHSKGQGFATACGMRGTPLWSQVWDLSPKLRTRNSNKWWGLDYTAPEERGYILEEEVEFYERMWKELAELHKARLLDIVDDAVEGDDETASSTPSGKNNF